MKNNTNSINSNHGSCQGIDTNLEKEIRDRGEHILKLKQEKDEFEKEKRTLKHDFEQSFQEIKLENEKLSNTIISLESLVESLKNTSKTEELVEKDKLLHEKEKQLSEFESKYLILEQSFQDVKRQNQNITIENTNQKFEIEKLKLNDQSNMSLNILKMGEEETELTLEEAKTLLSDYINENDDLKKEKEEISQKALQMLSEKELLLLELRENYDKFVEDHRKEVNVLLNQIQDYKEKIIELDDKAFKTVRN